MDKVLDFIKIVEKEYRKNLLDVQVEIDRLTGLIDETQKNIVSLDVQVDPSYAVMSASQADINSVDSAELHALKELMEECQNLLVKNVNLKKDLEVRVAEAQVTLEAYENDGSYDKKIDFIISLVGVDPHRAVEELKKLKSRLC